MSMMTAVMKQKNPNPQGKGLSRILDELSRSQARHSLPPKNIDQVSSELFTSLFVLNTNFQFRPVAAKSYWLYYTNNKFKLFLTAPDDWACGQPGVFIGECVLQNDITWTISLDPEIADATWFIEHIEEQKKRVQDSLENSASLEDAMPYYVSGISYYSRLLAYGLGTSLKTSMEKAGINTLCYEQAKGLLAHEPT